MAERETLRAAIEAIERAKAALAEAIHRQYSKQPVFTISIPARPDRDTDIIIAAGLRAAEDVLTAALAQPDAGEDCVDLAVACLRNYGADVECGACMEIAFTSATTNEHTCKAKPADAPPALTAEEPIATVLAEIQRAVTKFPTWPTDPLHAVAVVGEEFGELTKDVLQLVYEPHKTSRENVRKEAIQTAAMALRFVTSLDAYDYQQGPQHEQVRTAAERSTR